MPLFFFFFFFFSPFFFFPLSIWWVKKKKNKKEKEKEQYPPHTPAARVRLTTVTHPQGKYFATLLPSANSLPTSRCLHPHPRLPTPPPLPYLRLARPRDRGVSQFIPTSQRRFSHKPYCGNGFLNLKHQRSLIFRPPPSAHRCWPDPTRTDPEKEAGLWFIL